MIPKVRVLNRAHPGEMERELELIRADRQGINIMAPKSRFYTLKITGVALRGALIVKQEALSLDAEAALPRQAITLQPRSVDMLLMGTQRQLLRLSRKLKSQPFGLPSLGEEIEKAVDNLLNPPAVRLSWGSHVLHTGERTLIMGILNVTPDSFSDGGLSFKPEDALMMARKMEQEGADIIDIGGESTRPGSVSISEDEELSRIIPVIQALKNEINLPISIDTYKSGVAREAIEEGACIVNDVWGLKADPEMASIAARYNTPVVLMHNRKEAVYQDLMGEIVGDLGESITMALQAGVASENIIIDPGIGFGKTLEHNLEVMQRLSELKVLGCPILLGTSRKSMIGKVLDLNVRERVEGTAATVALGIAAGADIVRVHDVKEMRRVTLMTDAIVRRK